MIKQLLALCMMIATMLPITASACMMSEDEKAALFKTYDSDSNGEISVDEFLAGEQKRSSSYNEENLLEHFVDTDIDGSETLSQKEFSPTNGNKRCGG